MLIIALYQNEFFVAGAEDGTVSKYLFETMAFDKFLLRSSLPIRNVAISPNGRWCAVASDELTVKVVRTNDPSSVLQLRQLDRPVKHLTFDPSSNILALSSTDGQLYIYSLAEEEPELVKKLDGLIRRLEAEDESSSKAVWHPDGRAFAVPTATRNIQVISKHDWEKQRVFADGHIGDITALAWSPNGALLVSAGKDQKLLLWETKTQKVIAAYDYANVMDISWHPSQNIVSFSSSDGEVYIYEDFVSPEFAYHLQLGPQPAPFIHDPRKEHSANTRRPHGELPDRHRRQGTPNSLDDLLDSEVMGEEDDFVVDDDGAGYALNINGNGKRTRDDVDTLTHPLNKRRSHTWTPQYHEPFQPGSTPWRGNRKYLCLNLVGFVWTIDQDTHHTITAEFYDHESYRDFHFTDTFRYDKACLNETGTLLSSPSNEQTPATIFFRPHETWTARVDWRTELPRDEEVTAMSLSKSFITVITTKNYVRIYTLYGIPYRIYRQKSSPAVSCAAWRDYVLTLGNGPIGADGNTQLLYSIRNITRDETCQNEDIVALPEGATVKSVFFSDKGVCLTCPLVFTANDDQDPCIYDSTGTLLTLLNWRTPAQASWVPLLDTNLLSRLASGRKTESYFPVAAADDKFHCIILKGGDQYPYFPRPLLSEFDFEVPLRSQAKPALDADDDADMTSENTEMKRLESEFMLSNILAQQKQHLVDNTTASHSDETELNRLEMSIDKTLLRMLMAECIEGEERGMRALDCVRLMRDHSGTMMEAASKVAQKCGRTVLGEKIRELAELMDRS